MGALTELKGTELGTTKVRIESGPVRVFATAVKDGSPSYRDDDAVVPPTFPFSWSYWGHDRRRDQGTADRQAARRGGGRMILHGEQEFVYHRNAHVGDVLEGTARISDVYEKDTSSALMEFYVMETSWKDASSGDPVVDVKFTLIVRDTGVKKRNGEKEASMPTVVDSDQHLYEPRSMWHDHIDPSMRDDAFGWRTTTEGSPG